jgi:hypothetical protein
MALAFLQVASLISSVDIDHVPAESREAKGWEDQEYTLF